MEGPFENAESQGKQDPGTVQQEQAVQECKKSLGKEESEKVHYKKAEKGQLLCPRTQHEENKR